MRLKLALALTASFAAIPAAASADEARGVYMGVFAGGGVSTDSDISQHGTVYFVEAAGGPLAVNANGQADGGSAWFVGGHAGYELSTDAAMTPAFEIEGLYVDTGSRSATLQNPNDRGVEQTFEDSFSTDSFVLLANLVFSAKTSFSGFTPYVGGGLGGARVSLDGASSVQTNPAEPGVNHFNTDADTSAWTFAAQAKAGARIALGGNAYAFGEYRLLHIGSVDQTLGSTVYPGHAPTSPWTLGLDGTSLHLATAGIGFSF